MLQGGDTKIPPPPFAPRWEGGSVIPPETLAFGNNATVRLPQHLQALVRARGEQRHLLGEALPRVSILWRGPVAFAPQAAASWAAAGAQRSESLLTGV